MDVARLLYGSVTKATDKSKDKICTRVATTMLHQLMLLIGYFVLGSRANQLLLLAKPDGDKTILQLLCSAMPFRRASLLAAHSTATLQWLCSGCAADLGSAVCRSRAKGQKTTMACCLRI